MSAPNATIDLLCQRAQNVQSLTQVGVVITCQVIDGLNPYLLSHRSIAKVRGNDLSYVVAAGLVIAGIIHILPISGVLGAGQLNQLYGANIENSDLIILMRHRAVLFALLGTFMFLAVFKPHYQLMAVAGGLISTCSFLWLAWSGDGYGASLEKVVMADIIAIVALLAAGSARLFTIST